MPGSSGGPALSSGLQALGRVNAAIESFFSSLKIEMTARQTQALQGRRILASEVDHST